MPRNADRRELFAANDHAESYRSAVGAVRLQSFLAAARVGMDAQQERC
jgi:hypothetical protein